MTPYKDITFACVVWNDAERLRPLLEHVRPFFETVAVAVQESPDDTLAVAVDLADIVVKDGHKGYGDATFGPKLLPQIQTKWTFKVDADEWPTETLLRHLGDYVAQAEKASVKGVWIPFRSWVEGTEYAEQHSHLRLFHNASGWPASLHSRPPIENGIMGNVGYLEHRRGLSEMMQDYVVYYNIGKGNPGWDAHNIQMMKSACDGVAATKGWDFVRGHDWWPDVRDAAYQGKEPVHVTVYCSGASRSGTRMLFDVVNAMTKGDAVHAVLPGYHDAPGGGPDIDNPVWWTREEMEGMFGPGKWIIIERDPRYAAQSALAAGRIKAVEEYDDIEAKVHKTLPYDDALVLSYAKVVASPQTFVDQIAEYLGVASIPANGIFDANEKHREAVEALMDTPDPEPTPELKAESPKRSSKKAAPAAPATEAVAMDAEIASDEAKEAE